MAVSMAAFAGCCGARILYYFSEDIKTDEIKNQIKGLGEGICIMAMTSGYQTGAAKALKGAGFKIVGEFRNSTYNAKGGNGVTVWMYVGSLGKAIEIPADQLVTGEPQFLETAPPAAPAPLPEIVKPSLIKRLVSALQ